MIRKTLTLNLARVLRVAAGVATLGFGTSHASAVVVTLLDTFTGADSYSTTSSTPRTYMGDAFTNTALPSNTGSFQITGVTIYMASVAATSYTDITARLQFWNTWNGNTATTAFANSAGFLTLDLGALTTVANTFVSFTGTLATPITLTGGPGTNWGFVQNFQGNTGSGLADDPNLTSLIRYDTTSTGFAAGSIVTGTSPIFGYYRNANSETNFNFTSAPRNLGVNYEGIVIQLTGNAIQAAPMPEPSTWVLMLGGGPALMGVWFVRRRKLAEAAV